MLKTINIKDVVPGMYVANVTKQTGKIKITSAGILKNESAVSELTKKGILEVTIDLSKGTQGISEQAVDEHESDSDLTYNQQLERALKLHDQAKNIQEKLIKRVAKGKIANLEDIDEITQAIVDVVFECEDAVGLVTLIKDHDDYFIEHSVNCAILMVMFGRALSIEKSTLYNLGCGALLMDIGMLKLPLLLTQKPDSLSESETSRMQRHVDIALEMLESLEDISEESLTVVKEHHERIDGSGYPDGLRENQISEYGKMAAIVDIYDSLTTNRPYREALKPADALKELEQQNFGLCPALVKQFVSCIGANPVGSLVKLASGKLAMVMRLNTNQPMSPVVMTFYDMQTKQDEVIKIDLSKVEDEIVDSVSPDDFGISMPHFIMNTLSTK